MMVSHHRHDPACDAAIDDVLVVIKHGDRKQPRLELDPRPFKAEAIRSEAKRLDEIEID